jgi:hypothetical protein
MRARREALQPRRTHIGKRIYIVEKQHVIRGIVHVSRESTIGAFTRLKNASKKFESDVEAAQAYPPYETVPGRTTMRDVYDSCEQGRSRCRATCTICYVTGFRLTLTAPATVSALGYGLRFPLLSSLAKPTCSKNASPNAMKGPVGGWPCGRAM